MATPPSVGVGRVCHLSPLGRLTHPNRRATREDNGTKTNDRKRAAEKGEA